MRNIPSLGEWENAWRNASRRFLKIRLSGIKYESDFSNLSRYNYNLLDCCVRVIAVLGHLKFEFYSKLSTKYIPPRKFLYPMPD